MAINNNTIFDNLIKHECTHYKNNVEIFAECCNKYYNCNKCHNELSGNLCKNILLSVKTKKMMCKKCKTENTPSNECKNCKIQFGKSCCLKCNIWCSNSGSIFHCDKCKCCRMGNKDDFFHCDTCNLCLSVNCIDFHKCSSVDRNLDCPICLVKIFNENKEIIILKCNHLLHSECFENLIKNSSGKIPQCTLCKKSAVSFLKYVDKYDKHVNDYPMPPYYNNWKSNILCNDCCVKSDVKYHKDYQKCLGCRSYNTTTIVVNK